MTDRIPVEESTHLPVEDAQSNNLCHADRIRRLNYFPGW